MHTFLMKTFDILAETKRFPSIESLRVVRHYATYRRPFSKKLKQKLLKKILPFTFCFLLRFSVKGNHFTSLKGGIFVFLRSCGADESFLNTCGKDRRFSSTVALFFEKKMYLVIMYYLHCLKKPLARKKRSAYLEDLFLGHSAL